MNHRHPGTGDTQHDDAERILVEELRTVLHRVADASFEVSVTYDIAKRVLKEEFIANTHRRLLERGEPATQSRIAFITGIDAKTVGQVLDRRKAPRLPPLTVEERVVKCWANDPDFLDRETGQPIRLLLYGPNRTFQQLARRVVRGVTPKTVTDRLDANDAIAVSKFWVELINPDWKPPLTQNKLKRFLRRLHAELGDS